MQPAQVSLAKWNNCRMAIDIARESRDMLGGAGITTEHCRDPPRAQPRVGDHLRRHRDRAPAGDRPRGDRHQRVLIARRARAAPATMRAAGSASHVPTSMDRSMCCTDIQLETERLILRLPRLRGLRALRRDCSPTRKPRATSAAACRAPRPGASSCRCRARGRCRASRCSRSIEKSSGEWLGPARSLAARRLAGHRGGLGLPARRLGQGLRAPKPRPRRSTGPSTRSAGPR